MFEQISNMMVNRAHNQGLRLVIKKNIFYILLIYIIFMLLKSSYGVYQYNKIYNEFKKTEITHNIDISTLKDSYVLLEGTITSEPSIFEDEFIKSTNTFVYLEETKDNYRGKTGWETDSTYKFYADNVYVCNIPIDLKTFDINNSEGIKEEDINEAYKKYYNRNLYFNKSDGSMDKRVVYKVLRNNDDILIFSKVKDGKLVSLSNINDSIIFAGGDNYKRLDRYLENNYKECISLFASVCFAILVLVLYHFKKSNIIFK
ncbi:hypothetical protein [Clostridium sp.]|uniref:hypothetical protein n=1 Tax=Clostridium sp. TaxID=1506 RepID=UPI00284B24B6|nr:hypothetical protein [Clostridium sp.]MDR3598747.1 hypothetical protein [Clostridium sp.]